VFDLEHIVAWLAKNSGVHPVTGSALSRKQLIDLHYHRNADGTLALVSRVTDRKISLSRHL
jgi:hypothetical protein